MPTHTASDTTHFATADVAPDVLQQMTSDAVGEPVRIIGTRPRPFDYDWGSIPTAGLWRVDVDYDGTRRGTYSYFVKLLRNPLLWPQLSTIPEQFRAAFLEQLPWRFEYDIHDSGIAAVLPDGMRMANLHHVKTIGNDYLSLWWEYVELDEKPWNVDDYVRTAYLLGRLAARRRKGAAVNAQLPQVCHSYPDGGALRCYTEMRVLARALPSLNDPGLWQHPIMAQAMAATGDAELPSAMCAVVECIPAILDRLDTLPQTFAHGDASPQNLLIPAADRSERIVIDWGFGTPLPVGFDLGQLLIGLAHAGELDPGDIGRVDAAILPAYLDGLADEGYAVDPADVRYGYVGGMTARSALVSLPTELLDEPDDSTLELMTQRLRLTRVLVDMAQSLE